MIRRPPRSPLFPSPPLSRSGAARGAGGAAPPVRIAVATTHDVPMVARTLGTVLANSTVTVKPQIDGPLLAAIDRKSTRLNSSHLVISYAVFCLKKKKKI